MTLSTGAVEVVASLSLHHSHTVLKQAIAKFAMRVNFTDHAHVFLNSLFIHIIKSISFTEVPFRLYLVRVMFYFFFKYLSVI